MSSEPIRPVIDCFCQILSLYGFSTITSDIFHLAKFDDNEAVRLKREGVNKKNLSNQFCFLDYSIMEINI
jgi:hypothetical protein